MNAFDRIVEGVTGSDSMEASLTKLIQNIGSEILLCKDNETAIASLGENFKNKSAAIVQHVLATTPMIVGTHPAPAHAKAEHHKEEHDDDHAHSKKK